MSVHLDGLRRLPRQRGGSLLRNIQRFRKPHDCRSDRGVFVCPSGRALFFGTGTVALPLETNNKQQNMKRTRIKAKWQSPRTTAEVPLRVVQASELEQLKQRLLTQRLATAIDESDLRPAYLRAAHDAASLAWLTPYPLLFLPQLFEEKAEEAKRRTERQRKLLNRSSQLAIA